MRIARDLGDVSSLLPEGYSLGDCPYPLAEAIRYALHFLSFEEVETKYRPDKHIWLDGEAMEAHWAWVEKARKEEFGVDGEKDIEGDVSENDAARSLIVG